MNYLNKNSATLQPTKSFKNWRIDKMEIEDKYSNFSSIYLSHFKITAIIFGIIESNED